MERSLQRATASEKGELSSVAAVPRELVEAQLQKILNSPLFRKAPRHSRFLSFVVGKALAGEGDGVKEYVIGVEVFDRSQSYDPGSNPVVRAEARRLRSRLAEYYRDFGQHDPVHIELPKGTYVPVFHRNGAAAAAEEPELHVEEKPRRRSPQSEISQQKKRSWVAWLVAFALLLIISGGDAIYRLASKKSLPAASPAEEQPMLVLADFTNTTGDPVFDDSLRQGLSSQLEQSPFLNVLSDQRIAQTLSLMSLSKDTRLTNDLAREVCQRTASSAMIEGSIATVGGQYALALQATNCQTGSVFAREHISVANKQDILKALAEASSKLRHDLGESLPSLKRYDVAPESVTTASLEALQAYSHGSRAMMVSGDYDAAIKYFQRATSLDPNFAMAYARMGTSYANVNQNERAADNLRQAYALRQRVSDRERFYIDSHYYQLVTGDDVAARATYELWAQTYPTDDVPMINLGRTYAELGDYDKSLASYQKALKLGPETGLLYGNLVYSYLSTDRLDEARATAQQAWAHHLDSPWIHLYLYWLDFVQHDNAGMARDVASVTGKPGADDLAFYLEANTAAYGGQLNQARELTGQAAESAKRADDKDTAAGYMAIEAVHEALVGNSLFAKQQAQSALALSPSKEVQSLAGLALALAGDGEQSTRMATNLAKLYPEDTWVQFMDVPTIHAALALQRGNPQEAIKALAPSAPYELGRGDLIWLYPVYLRAQAYLAAQQSTAAIAEFQVILSHPGLVLNEPIGALAHLGLGRAYAQAGDTTRARTAYQDFLALWKDADTELPVLKEAKAEYSKLQ